ncbi:tail fiber assembly protein [Serratia marcescens]|nr:tail fiber assembly protein [Serratia marcescens]AWC89333.1 tail fiber assembly protein [Serratia marcescens]AWS58462.1 tail fiber assembly protein [Serratia marcescens]AWS69841.1 tail fiber assembly protein [Serratia marcescens]EIY2713048.1 tail fiber assembly protein [Serratia marcescens]
MYVYSAEKNAFYPLSMLEDYAAVGAWPDDGIDVDEAVFQAFTGQPPEGKQRGSSKGRPCWVDIPPPTAEQQHAGAERRKASLMALAGKALAPLQDADDLGMATEEEAAQLKRWKTYRVQLSRINPQDAPDIDWPVAPGA